MVHFCFFLYACQAPLPPNTVFQSTDKNNLKDISAASTSRSVLASATPQTHLSPALEPLLLAQNNMTQVLAGKRFPSRIEVSGVNNPFYQHYSLWKQKTGRQALPTNSFSVKQQGLACPEEAWLYFHHHIWDFNAGNNFCPLPDTSIDTFSTITEYTGSWDAISACYNSGGIPHYSLSWTCTEENLDYIVPSRCFKRYHHADLHECQTNELICEPYQRKEVIDGAEMCLHCPPAYFNFSTTEGCYRDFAFSVQHGLSNSTTASPPYVNNHPVFSPRDTNGKFDSLLINIGSPSEVDSHFNWYLDIINPKRNSFSKLHHPDGDKGHRQLVYTGWNQDQCLVDGRYYAKFTPQGILPLDDNNHLVQPDAAARELGVGYIDKDTTEVYAVNVYVKLAESPFEFWVDNTPPIIKDFDADEIPSPQNPDEIVRTDIRMLVHDPKVDEAYSGIKQSSLNLKVFIDDDVFAQPRIDINGFWLTGQVPDSELTVQELDERTAEVTLSVPYGLTGHQVRVEVEDNAANQGTYIVYPQGSN